MKIPQFMVYIVGVVLVATSTVAIEVRSSRSNVLNALHLLQCAEVTDLHVLLNPDLCHFDVDM